MQEDAIKLPAVHKALELPPPRLWLREAPRGVEAADPGERRRAGTRAASNRAERSGQGHGSSRTWVLPGWCCKKQLECGTVVKNIE